MGFTESGEAGAGGVPAAHASSHEDGGADSLDVTNLTGDLADPQVAGGIKTATTVVSVEASAAPTSGQILKASSGTLASWQNDSGMVNHDLGGVDHNADTLANLNLKISDATLIDTGDARLSDARTPTSHNLAGAEHAADTLANLNLKISDATLIDTGDSRLSDARTPTSHASTHNAGGGDAMAIDAVAGTGSLRTLGTSATAACAGNDARLSDARTPTSHASSHNAGGGDALAIDAVAGTGSLRTLGTAATAACAGNDARLSNARTPTSHAASHLPGGGDALTVGTPSSVGTANAAGSIAAFARQDHIHNHGNQTTGTHHAAAIAGSTSGFLTGADKSFIDALGLSMGNAVWVSKSGNDGTAVLHNAGRPYLTIQAAISAATAGDVIIVLPGTYTGPFVMKTGVSVVAFDPRNTVLSQTFSANGTMVTMAELMWLHGFLFIATVNSTFTGKLIAMSGTMHQTSTITSCWGLTIGAGDGVAVDASSCAGLATATQVAMRDCNFSVAGAAAARGYIGGGTAATLHVRIERCSLIATGTGSIGASVVGELSANNCYFSGVSAGVSCLTPSANNKFNYNQGTGWNSLTGGGTLARLWSGFDNALNGNSVYVDKILGSDTTGIINDRSRPFLTIQAAIDAASSGMVVEVGPGSYSELVTAKAGVNVRMAPGAILTNTGAGVALLTMGVANVTWQGGAINPAPGSGTSTAITFTGTANETSKIKDVSITGSGAGTTNGVSLSGTTNATADPHNCIENVAISVNGVDIVPHAVNTNNISGTLMHGEFDKNSNARFLVQCTPTIERQVGLQKGSAVSMFFQILDVGTTTLATRGPLIGRAYADAATQASFWATQVDERHITDGAVTLKMVWYNDTLQTGITKCGWSVEYDSLVGGDIVPASAEVTVAATATLANNQAAYTISESYASIPAAHANNFHLLGMRIVRNGTDAVNDTMTGNAVLCMVRLACLI